MEPINDAGELNRINGMIVAFTKISQAFVDLLPNNCIRRIWSNIEKKCVRHREKGVKLGQHPET